MDIRKHSRSHHNIIDPHRNTLPKHEECNFLNVRRVDRVIAALLSFLHIRQNWNGQLEQSFNIVYLVLIIAFELKSVSHIKSHWRRLVKR